MTEALKVLVVHNFYQQAGGEDAVFRAETLQLVQMGIPVGTYTVRNDDLQGGSKLSAAGRTIWNPAPARALAERVRREGINVVHFHNTFPIISPAAYSAVRHSGAAVVQTLHNFRLLCANGLLFRDGQPCEACLGKTPPWPAVQHACYRGSRAASAVVAGMLTAHRLLHTYQQQVDSYIALTEFARQKYLQGGLPADKITVKPNFLAQDPGPGQHQGNYALFVGRLSPEKGIDTLLRAWEKISDMELKIAGDGPQTAMVTAAARRQPNITYLGRQDKAQVQQLMQDASFLIFPSEWYEGFPMTLIEAFACGLPAVVSRIGSLPEIVEPGRSGLHFTPGDADDLRRQVGELREQTHKRLEMGQAARNEYETKYTALRNGLLLTEIYQHARHQKLRQGVTP